MFGLLKDKTPVLTEEEVRNLVKNDKKVTLLDVRNAMEYRPEHLTPCQHVDVREKDFKDKIKYYETDKTYILYCKSGQRSKKARKIMTNMGFGNVYVLDGGINKWVGPLKIK
ncbi:MAG: rhodanese-like domain-containing protein [Cyclobacteriaceae bacterium]